MGTALIDHLIYSPTPLQDAYCNRLNNGLCSGGSMRNIAYNLGRLNRPVDFLSCWGNDSYAENLKDELTCLNVKVHGPQKELPTPIFTAINTPNQHLSISSFTPDFLINKNYDFPYENYDLLVTDIDDHELLTKIIAQNNEIEIIAMGFFPPRNIFVNLQGMIFNRNEFFALFSKEALHSLNIDYEPWTVVTMDKDGLYYGYRHTQGQLKNKREIKTGYPIGCGDALAAGLIYQLDQGQDFLFALNFAHDLAEELYQSTANVI